MSIASDAGRSPEGSKLQLEPVLDLGAAERLHAQLMGMRGQSLDIDASQVERLGGLCLQVLLSTRSTWANDGHRASISAASPAFEEAWTMFAAPAFSDLTDQQGQDA